MCSLLQSWFRQERLADFDKLYIQTMEFHSNWVYKYILT